MNNNFDKYSLFVERSIQLLNDTGRLGFIIPNKFLTIQSGEALRTIIYNNKLLSELSNFGSQKVFQGKDTYTCLLTLYKGQCDKFIFNNIYDLEMWRHNSLKGKESSEHLISKYPPDKTWVFLNNTIKSILDGIKVNNPSTIENIAKPFVGLQTSADSVFILKKNISYDDKFIYFTDKEKKVWEIERSITRPILYRQGISLFSEPDIQAFAIFPYKSFEQDKAIIYSLEELQNNFPVALRTSIILRTNY
ncbi:Eco57I restriction-modification methylase domain-containing protein [Lysinibacillus sp. JK80]|nr:Eco57I restriction-modification methylase domain-containing protein [Lysinibacillus sp. JK80]